MRIWTSTGLPEPHPDEHEPFNETGSPLSAGVSLVLPLQCSSSLLAPQAKTQGPLERHHTASSAPSNPTDCTSSYVLLFNQLQPRQLPIGEERHIYISGKTDPCTSPVRSQNLQKAGRKQVWNRRLLLSVATTLAVETGVCGFAKVNWKPSESTRGWAKPQAYFSCKARTWTGIPEEPIKNKK